MKKESWIQKNKTISAIPSTISIIDLVDRILNKALAIQASDIHLETQATRLRVRYRIDGVLYDQESISITYAQQLITRIKILANINISQKRLPQDGKFQIMHDTKEIDCRVSTFPSFHGEKIVIRILDARCHNIDLASLGFSDQVLMRFKELIGKSYGLILVTGPTGSGKTTTLYAALSFIHSAEKNIITLEDPVEYNIDGITQGQIHVEAGFTFERGIRALLRQDPDVAMIGEIRDKESARIAIEAALTGHLVLSTLHTNDAVSTVMRLMDMSIEPFLMNAALSGVLAQRLVRKICAMCKQSYIPSKEEQNILTKVGVDFALLYKGAGCSVCFYTGYKGRIGIVELLVITNKLRAVIVQNPQFDIIFKQALADGMIPLMSEGLEKVRQGIIPLCELLRVLN